MLIQKIKRNFSDRRNYSREITVKSGFSLALEENNFHSFVQLMSKISTQGFYSLNDIKEYLNFPESYVDQFLKVFGDGLSGKDLLRIKKFLKRVEYHKIQSEKWEKFLFEYKLFPEQALANSNDLPDDEWIYENFYQKFKRAIPSSNVIKAINGLLKTKKLLKIKISVLFKNTVKSKILIFSFNLPKGNKYPPVIKNILEKKFWIILKQEMGFEKERFNDAFAW